MSNDRPSKGAFITSIAAGVLHILSAVAAFVFYWMMNYGGRIIMEAVPFLVIFAILLAFLSIVGLAVAIIQSGFGVAIIVTGALRKKKLCALFCGLPLLADAITAFCTVILGCSITGGLNSTTVPLAIDLLLLALLSIASIVLSIIAMVKNLSKKSACEDNCK